MLPKEKRKNFNQVIQSRESSPKKKSIKTANTTDKMNKDSLKKTSEETISLYLKYLSCGIMNYNYKI